MQTMSFENWVRAWFDHPDDWDWIRGEFPEISNTDTLAFATHLFTHAGELLQPYSNTQVGKGLHRLIWEGDSPLTALFNLELPRTECRTCLKSIYRVYKEVFATRCPELLSQKTRDELHHVCFMWWDIFPLYKNARTELNSAVLDVLERALALPHLACQESALHGLGHWQGADPKRVQGIIDAFLATKGARLPELVSYAQTARRGMVL